MGDLPTLEVVPKGRQPVLEASWHGMLRLLANARERTRVHTISAAFEALRKQVPCYSYGQKLSKLAILRIACNYILSLARLADLDYSADHRNMSFSECVEQCTRTLQAEGRSKKRKVAWGAPARTAHLLAPSRSTPLQAAATLLTSMGRRSGIRVLSVKLQPHHRVAGPVLQSGSQAEHH
ncbi:protein atonal homolog 8 [Varanus komodoensis]|uniref:protein atonal homolog 8 n=1 Tax=Varanus komodoensis TaxID=61221 RepID=UPI001CF7EA94|nr:protein atonal homolog 8 [Varanus komodoensis]